MSQVLDGLTQVRNVKEYNIGFEKIATSLQKLRVPLVGGKGSKKAYNREWLYRQVAIAKAHLEGVKRLSFGKDDAIAHLPGPNKGGFLKTLAKQTKCEVVTDLYDSNDITIPPEYVALAGCLNHGGYRQGKAGSSKAARMRAKGAPRIALFKPRWEIEAVAARSPTPSPAAAVMPITIRFQLE